MSHEPYDHTIAEIEDVALRAADLVMRHLTRSGEIYACVGMINGLINNIDTRNTILGPKNNDNCAVKQ